VKVPESAPSMRTTRKSTWSAAKASIKKDVGQLVQRLAKSFHEVVQTLEEIVELDSN
jgi:predicted transcriptional regulator